MTSDNPTPSVLVIGRTQRVLDEILAGLHELGYSAQATNDFFADIPARFDPAKLDLVVFGGAVPPERKAELRQQIASINPAVAFVQGLAGIPGLIINQIQGAFAGERTEQLSYSAGERSIQLTVAAPHTVKVSVWWITSAVPPTPASESLVLLDERVAAGTHTVRIPDQIPTEGAFATVQVDDAIDAFGLQATDRVASPEIERVPRFTAR